MYCRECGTEIAEGVKYCPQCGQPVAIEQNTQQDKKAQTNWIALVSAFDRSQGEARSEAFARLYEASYDAVYAHVYRYARNEDVTLDVVQNAYITCWNRIDQLQNAGNFLPWMKRIAYNAFIDTVRAGAHEQGFGVVTDDEGNETGQEAFLADDSLPMPEDAYANEELRQLLMTAINELSDVQRVVIKRFYYDSQPVQAIAEELDMPTGTVKTHLSRGRKALGQRVQSYANAYGLRLVPLALIPLLASLAKEDVYAAERVAAAAGGTALASLQAITGVTAGTGHAASAATSVTAGASGSAAGSTIGTSVGAAAGTSLAVKLGIGVAAIAVAAGGTGVYLHTRTADPQEEVVVESTTVETTETEEGPVLQEDRVEILYQYVTDNMTMAQEPDLQGAYHVEAAGDPANPSWYGLFNGEYKADDGVYAAMRQDLDQDGDEELLVLSRSYVEAAADGEDTADKWQFFMQVTDMAEDGSVFVTAPQTILEMSESGNGGIGPDTMSVVLYYKDLGDATEILCRWQTENVINVSGERDEVTGYRYQDGRIEMVGRASFAGSDATGIGEDEELLASLRELGLDTTAAALEKYTVSYVWQPGDAYEGMLSRAEEGITSVLEIRTETDLDRDAWWDAERSGDPMAFDVSAYSISQELYIYDVENMVYSSTTL